MGTFVFIWRFTVQKIKGSFGIEEKTKESCSLGRTNYGTELATPYK